MDVTSALLTAGVWPAVLLTGYLAVACTARLEDGSVSALTAGALFTVAGLAVWSVPLLASVVAGVYRPPYVGMAGWAITVIAVFNIGRRWSVRPHPARHSRISDWLLLAGLLAAGSFYLGYPTESIYGGRDEGVYANHAVYMAHHGRLDVPYPWPADAEAILASGWNGFPGFYNTTGSMTVQFGHLFPVWLAEAYATLGQSGLFRLNAIFALLALAALYDVLELTTGGSIALVAVLFLAFNPGELWMARITLSEILTQLFVWSGLCFLLRALQQERAPLARCAGICLGVSALVRFDSLFLLPMLLLAHVGYRTVAEPTSRGRLVWKALYVTALPLFALGAGYFFAFSRPYLRERPYVETLAIATGGATILLLASRPAIAGCVRRWLRHRVGLSLVGLLLLLLAAYAYWIRPMATAPPYMMYQWPGFYIDQSKGSYRSETLVDLAMYLSPLVVWGAIGGWYLNLRDIVFGRCEAYHVVPLVLVAGFSFAYLYDPSNTPDHLWWIRRFTPVVVPGFILYAAYAAHGVLRRLSPRWAAAAAAIMSVFLVGFTVHADRLILTFAEDAGLFSQLESLAQKLPAGAPIIMHAHKSWETPLYVAFDRQVIPLDLTSAVGERTFQAWAAYRAADHQPIYILSEIEDGVQPPIPTDVTLSRVITEPTVGRLPEKVLAIRTTVRLVRTNDPHGVLLPP